jgi:hypothetical protein
MADRLPTRPPHQPTLKKSPEDAPLPPTSERCRVSLIKGEHRWQFRWDPGCESQLIDRVARLAAQPDAPLDWYDAAVICRHIAQPFVNVNKDRPRPAA